MSIRPPRRPRKRIHPGRRRDVAVCILSSTAILLFSLRAMLRIVGVRPWVTGWKIVGIPTDLIISPLENTSALQHRLINQLTVADVAALVVVVFAAMFVLASLTVRPSD